MRIVVGLLISFVSAMVTIKANWLIENFGSMAWADRNLGIFGGSRLVIKLIGILGAFGGFLYAADLLDTFLDFAFGWLIPDVAGF